MRKEEGKTGRIEKIKKIFQKNDKKNKIKNDNRGMTLVELLVAIAILTLIVFPTMQVFVAATKANSKARTELQATVTANSVLESAKAFSIYVYDKQCNTVYTAANAGTFSLMAGTTTDSFVSSAYGGTVGSVELDGGVVKNVYKRSTAFTESAESYAYAINGVKQTNNTYDVVIVFDKADYRDVEINTSGGTISKDEVESIYPKYNKVYDISIYVYRHESTPAYIGKNLSSNSGALVEITGSKFDSALRP